MESEKKQNDELIEKQNDNELYDEKDKIKADDENEDDFKGYSKAAKFQLFGLFFLLGIINHLGTILVMTGGRLLAYELDMKDYVTIYTSVATIFSVLTRIINSKLCLKVSYKKRVVIICFWMMAGYSTMFAVLQLHETVLSEQNVLCFVLSFIPCFFLGSSYAFGEAAMIAYLRLFPKTLIAGWSSGTGLSGLISGGLNFLSQMVDNLPLKYMYLILTPVGFLYLLFFIWTYRILKSQERHIEKVRRESMGHIPVDSTIEHEEDKKNDEEKKHEEEEDIKSIREEEKKEMENMNKANQTMSLENFSKVMSMVGRVIINLGSIYFLQFFCVNALIVKVASKLDIGFLPLGCSDNHHPFRKGKFEFINLAYQIGMFTSKTFIKIVRRIQPIEVYTIVIGSMNIIYIIEYYTGFAAWYVLFVLGLILGFFSGGTYAGGFYTILNSDRVQKDYKELTVNVATLFNDSGTFLSGILGFLAIKFWINSDEAFEGQELDPTC
jgi:hypothetical protein